MNNRTNATTNQTYFGYGVDLDFALIQRLHSAYAGTASLYVLVGTPLCVWFVAAILTSPDMRKRLRNQLLCAIWLAYMLKSTVSGGLEFSIWRARSHGHLGYNCYVTAFMLNLRNVVEFAGSWLVVNLLMVYLAQIVDYDPTSTLTPLAVNMGKLAMLVLPFVLAIIIIPSVAMHFTKYYLKITSPGCILYNADGFLVTQSVNYMVPVIISAILLIVAVGLYFSRFRQRFLTSAAMQTEQTSRHHRPDNAVAYLVAIFVDLAFRMPRALVLEKMDMDGKQWFIFTYIGWMVIDARSIILPWCWLLLEDIRERIKTWRPWYRPAPGIDLTVMYSREENASGK